MRGKEQWPDWVRAAKLSAFTPALFNAVYCITNPQLSVRVFIGQNLDPPNKIALDPKGVERLRLSTPEVKALDP
jgi:hypothetical protein